MTNTNCCDQVKACTGWPPPRLWSTAPPPSPSSTCPLVPPPPRPPPLSQSSASAAWTWWAGPTTRPSPSAASLQLTTRRIRTLGCLERHPLPQGIVFIYSTILKQNKYFSKYRCTNVPLVFSFKGISRIEDYSVMSLFTELEDSSAHVYVEFYKICLLKMSTFWAYLKKLTKIRPRL